MRKNGRYMICKICGKKRYVKLYHIKKGWGKYCSMKCLGKSKIGIHPKGEFKKGCPAPKTAFKKGNIPWDKGKKRPETTGKNHWHWKGGKIETNGYIYVYQPSHPFCECKGYVKRANLVMEKILGRYIIPPELVHHKGTKYPFGSIKNKQDDRPENLQLFPNNSEHMKFPHHKKVNKKAVSRIRNPRQHRHP